MFRRAAVAGAVVVGCVAPSLAGAPAHAAPRTVRDAPTVVAHRGASAYAPENTLAAVLKARELGTEWVENDVQRTKDGKLVVIHDTTLSRTTDVEEVFPDRAPWNVRDFTYREIRRLDAGSWLGPSHAGARIPTLEQYVELLDRTGQNLLLEVKAPHLYPGIEAQILAELEDEGWLRGDRVRNRLVVQSFDTASLRTVHLLRPRVKTGFLGSPSPSALKEYAAFADQINPNHSTVTEDYVDSVHAFKGAHGKPLEVFTWTVNDAATARRVAGAGVDGIISNNPDVVADAT
ncbi:glycerophosphodiester phosphodiesterase [Streptomyces sp. HB2AG]|uniref:glycerophosphodiester phosphodiesterase n=1 Tax=Streptomyces sp. HB2AG TaxID=2983400 RepID=UPI0022AA7386|nr:glycerophosphodiester phosphodiesterase family protein [Streptomyces sp. HB2AG]MCZ2524911.1 glycerophosphodiester phosphodiesterase family protein [Streptomyces sp. HB2AG]